MLDLHDREWKEFRICDIFIIKAGKRLTKSDMTSGNKPFIGQQIITTVLLSLCLIQMFLRTAMF